MSPSIRGIPSAYTLNRSSPLSGLYVPIHKRTGSYGSTSGSYSRSTASSIRSVSPTLSLTSNVHELEQCSTQPCLVYSPAELILLAQSPIARLSQETRDALRDNFPRIAMNRRQRKSYEFQELNGAQNVRKPAGKLPERREDAPKVVGGAASWRGRWLSAAFPATVTV